MSPPSQLPPLGFIEVECFFTRPPGDPWNEQTWPFHLLRERATGSTADQLVTNGHYDQAFLDRFVAAGLRLAERGCVGIITSCGFLAMAQPQLAERLPIPIATSALIQVPSLLALLPPRKSIGILTFDGEKLGPTHLEQLGIPSSLHGRIHIAGARACGHLQRLVKEDAPYDRQSIQTELNEAALAMQKKDPGLGAIVLECTQMPPFAEGIQQVVGSNVAVYDVYSMAMWFYSGLAKRLPARWAEGAQDTKSRP
ncbi:hypothetical protein M409DRAFT_24839 [Zasmidium cellare ATCC 36951]|uniref:Aspartate/glutamate racemase family protein n=1 Tax=Zasmidium cellare ATCC 36951 TaxID=1080233 RepID=A0A6A6CFK2_ZASCE|nr:uncharacterized protein M409DRAFT_24839 [Zasmidium cellare ATCC 36951]KAF2164938.1 hypothetical protein M409DRAFT_24839 [Zasmidium cellare ATCC 36951]